MPQFCVYLVLTPTVTKGVRGAEKKRCRPQHIHLDILPSQLLCYTMENGRRSSSSSSSTSLATVCYYKVYRAAQQILLKSQGLAWLQDTLDVPGSLDHRRASGTWAEPRLCCDVLQ